MIYSPTAHCFYNCLKRYIIDDLVKTHSILKVSLRMKILAILLIPWGIVSAIPSFREVNLIKNEISNFNNQERQRKIPDIETVIPDKDELEPDATRSELHKRSLFPQFRKGFDFFLDKRNNKDVNLNNIFLNGFGNKLINDIIQSFFKVIQLFSSKEDLLKFGELNQFESNQVDDVFKDKFYQRQKKVDNEEKDTTKLDKSLKSTFNFKNEKIRKIDEEMLHSIIPQITANENRRNGKSENNEYSDKSDNDEFETKRRQLYTEIPDNVLRNKRDTHIPLCNTLNKDSKDCLVNSNRINANRIKNKQPSIESLNTDLAFTKIIQKANAEAEKFNEFQINVPDGEFSKWLDNSAGSYFNYPESSNTSPKYEPIATIKATSTETTLDKKPDNSVPIKTYIESDYKDLNLKWLNDEEYEFSKDLKKSSRMWQDNGVVGEAILIPPELDSIDKTTKDNNNAISNANSISKTTTSKAANLDVVSDSKDIYIPSDWIVKYKMMSDKNDDILFSKIASSTENHAGANSRTGIVREDEYKPLKSTQTIVQMNNDGISRSTTDDAIFKSKQVTSIATEVKPFVSGEKRKLSTWALDDTIVSDNNNIAIAAKSTAFTKAHAGNVAINEDNQRLTKWNIKNAIRNDENTTISNGKVAAPATVYPASGASSESKRESFQNSMKNNVSSNQTDGLPKIEIKADATVNKETRVSRGDKNEQLRKTATQKSVLNNKNNPAIVEKEILSKTVNSGVGVTYPVENSNIYEIQVPSEWIVKYESLDNKDDSLKFAKVTSVNLNARNNAATEDASNWANEPKVTRERDDKWSSLESNANTSAIQPVAVSTEKTEKLPNKRVKDNVQINKVLESTKTDAEAATVNNNDKEQWNNNEKVQSLNSQSVASVADNVEVAISTKKEKEQWKWNDTDKDLIIKNSVKSENKATTSAEINTNVAEATHNKNRQWNWNSDEKIKSTKDDVILNTKTAAFAAGNSEAAASAASNSKFMTATQSEEKQWNWVENSRVANMKNYDISNNERTAIVEDTYDAEEGTTDKKLSWTSNENEKHNLTSNNKVTTTDGTIIEEDKEKWKWDNVLKDLSVKNNVLLNNVTAALTPTDNIATAVSESEIQRRIWNNENKILDGQKDVASSNEAIATVGVSANIQSVIEDDKQQRQWDNKENTQTLKENGSSKNVTISSAKANANAAESTVSNKKMWKWDSADEVSSDKYDNLIANETELTSGTDVIIDVATDTNKKLLKLSDKNENSSEKRNVTSNSEATATAETGTNFQATIENKNQKWNWDNKKNAQIVRNDDASKGETILSTKANVSAAEVSTSNSQSRKWERADEVSSDKYGYLTTNKTDSSSGADVKANCTGSNTNLLKLNNRNENLNEEESIISNSTATASTEANANSQTIIKDENLRSVWDNKQNAQIKEDGSSNGVTISSAKTNANATESTVSNKKIWKWDSADEVSSDKYDNLIANETELTSGTDVIIDVATDTNKKLLKLSDKNENSSEKRNVTSNSEATATAETGTNFQATIENKNQKWNWDNKKNAQIVRNDDASKGETILSTKANVNAAEVSTSNSQSRKWERADEVSSDKYGYLTTNKTDSSSGADVKANCTGSNTNLLKLNNRNENLNEEESIISNSTATASTEANANSQTIIKDENLRSVWDNKQNAQIKEDGSSNGVTISSAKTNANAAESTVSNKKIWKLDRADEISSDKYDYLAANERDPPSRINVTANATTDDNKKLLNDKNKNVNEKENITADNKAITSTQTIADIAAVLENNNNQWDINSKSLIVKDNLIINNQSATSAVSNANATLIITRNKLQSKLDNENNDLSVKNDVTSNNKAAESAEAHGVAAVTTESEIKQKKLEDKNKHLNIKNNISVNNKTTVSAGAKTDAVTIMTDDQQQWWSVNENKDPSIKDDDVLLPNEVTQSTRANADAAAATANSKQLLTFNDEDDTSNSESDDILNLESAASARTNGEIADVTASYENARILDNRNKNPRLRVSVTSNTEKGTSARTAEETETGITLMTNNDNRKIFDQKTFDSISETFPSTINTAKIDLENKDENTLAEYNINDKGAWVRKDFISNSRIAALATAATKATSVRQNKEKSSDGIADRSVSSVTKIETDFKNENKEKLQSLELKNSTLKEERDKPSDRNSKDNNAKDNIDAMAFTKAIAYTINKGDVDTFSKEDTKPSEWKIKETNVQSHQDLVSHEKITVSTTAQTKADSVIEDQNKSLNKKVGDNNSYNNELSIANIPTATEAKVNPSIRIKDSQTKYNDILKDTEISKKSLENTKTSTSAIIEAEMNLVSENENKQFNRKTDNKNLMNNTNLKVAIEATKSIDAESNSVSTSNDIDKQIKWKYKNEDNINANDSMTDNDDTIDNGSDNFAIISSKEEDIISSLNKTSNNLINWLIRWRSINVNALESNKNERHNNTELNYWKLGNSNDRKYTIDKLDIPVTTDDKTKDSKEKIEEMDDIDLIVLKKPYGQQNTIGVTYIKDSVTPIVTYRVIPISVFEQVNKLIKQWEIIYTEYAKPQV
ncbi:MATH and LRR domain-containing protein PFE0570w-like [Vespula maculifrons]|uniref:MATH and LRR domain-containing protein PFE0570w-like n=1 Tax=Vespula maculifrons TaxID=7453 RepID=A0ABD2CGN5_VESMC